MWTKSRCTLIDATFVRNRRPRNSFRKRATRELLSVRPAILVAKKAAGPAVSLVYNYFFG